MIVTRGMHDKLRFNLSTESQLWMNVVATDYMTEEAHLALDLRKSRGHMFVEKKKRTKTKQSKNYSKNCS